MKFLKAITISTLVAAAAAIPAAAGRQDDPVVHVLSRLGYGPKPGDVERVRAMGIEKYIETQLEPSKIDDSAVRARLAEFETLGLSSSEMARRFFTPPQQRNQGAQRPATPAPGTTAAPMSPELARQRAQGNVPLTELSQQKLLRAIYSDRQLEEVLVDFWFNHFNVYSGKGQFARFYLTEYEREAIRPHVLGKFRDMLGATAKSPAMLWYLDNWMSAAPDSEPAAPAGRARSRGQAARRPAAPATGDPMMQEAQPARPPRGLNENYGRELLELHTLGVDGGYTQKDVIEVARAFTGWTIEAPRRGGGDFEFNQRIHDNGEKVVLGHKLPANGGQRDGERVLDIVAAHPSTAKHIARKLLRRFVTDTPQEALVDRIARTFLDTNGDLKKVTRAIITSPEFMASAGAKTKTPLEFVVSAIRATGAEVRSATQIVQQMRTLGMPLYGAQPPTGYDDTAASWVNSGALINRMNFAVSLVSNRLRGTRLALDAVDPDAIIAQDALSPNTRATVAKAADKSGQLALLLGSPEFQKK